MVDIQSKQQGQIRAFTASMQQWKWTPQWP